MSDAQTGFSQHHSNLRRLELVCWLVAVALGFLQAWGRRHVSAAGLRYVGADSISYLDIGDAYWHGHWSTAINAMWSPCYSWLTGLTLRLFAPTPYQEFTVIRLLNFIIYAAALAAFTFLLHELIDVRPSAKAAATDAANVSHVRATTKLLPAWILLPVGYACFVWTALQMNRVARISPDLLLSVWVYLAAALTLRLRRGDTRWRNFILLGLLFGLGYLTKTIMFPLAFVWLACLLFAVALGRQMITRVAGSLLIFILISAPFIFALSHAKHRLTIGDSARLNYAWYVNHVTPFTHWQGEPPGSGTPAHPTRRVFAAPDVYEFATPIGGTYPPWYDPTYWYEGVRTHFNLRQQTHASAHNLHLLALLIATRPFLLAALLALVLLYTFGGRASLLLHDVRLFWFLLLPALAACGLYTLINVELRYLAPFIALIVVSLYASLSLRTTSRMRWLVNATAIALPLLCLGTLAPDAARDLQATVRDAFTDQSRTDDVQWQAAAALSQLRVAPGTQVAVIGDAMYAAWPRLARVRVVAELPQRPGDNVAAFWRADETRRQQLVDACARIGAQVIVAENVPAGVTMKGWQRLGQTEHYIYFPSR